MRSGFLALTVALAAIAFPAAAQGPVPGRDLQGVWLDNSATPLERPKALDGRQFLTDAEVVELKQRADRIFKTGNSDFAAADNVFLAALANPGEFKNSATGGSALMIDRVFDNRTSLVVDPPDGKIPPLTAAAQSRRTVAALAAAAGTSPPTRVQDLNPALRCITPGVPRLGGRYGAGDYGYYEILQVPGYVVLFMEVLHEARIIPLDGRAHLSANVRTWTGDSLGHWEDNTLVVDTTNFSPQANFMGSGENLHLVERFTLVASDEIRYEISIDDPTTWTRPWAAMVRLRKTNERLYEYACHEDNRPLEGILAGARVADKERLK